MSGFAVLICVLLWVPCVWSQAVPTSSTGVQDSKTQRLEALKKYVGRYQLEVGLIPISTLDVTLENNELWLKPSGIKKRRLKHRARTIFIDEIAGTPCTFTKDEDGNVLSLTFEYEGSNYTAQRVVLPQPALKGNTTFKLKGYSDANVVVLAGTFNNWNQSQFVCGREGDEWVCRIDLEPGRYSYKFIVDGNWILDPGNPLTEEDAAGNVNSVLVVLKGGN
jgi:Glycogen recognition site of AMP-activated protein kinase/Domain of unknown function (DUF3471)